jgi:hypothetical protein
MVILLEGAILLLFYLPVTRKEFDILKVIELLTFFITLDKKYLLLIHLLLF